MADITLDTLRLFVNERLAAVAEDILSVFVRTIFQYQQEIDIQRRQLDSLNLNPDIRCHASDFFPVCKTEASPEQYDRRPILAQKEPKITEELEELLQWPEQADRLTMTVPSVKTDVHNKETEHTKPQADVEDCGASQPSSHVQPLSSHCSDSDTEDSDEWEDTRESLNTQNVESLPLKNLSQDLKSSRRTPSSRSYRGKRRYGCTHCGKRFLRSANLKVHMSIHTEEKPLSCKVCGKKYALKVHLGRHMRAHKAEKAISCPVCGKEFTRSGHLKVHMITHTGEKPFKCTICGRGFNIKKNLTRHTWTHTGEKPFHCTGCGKGYIEMCDLRKHLRKTICGNSYGVHVYSTNT